MHAGIAGVDEYLGLSWRSLTNTVSAGIVPPLTEKQGLAGPVVVDLDFRFSSDVKHRCYTPDGRKCGKELF